MQTRLLAILGALAVIAAPLVSVFAAPVRADDAWRGEYFNNTTLSGSPVLVRYDSVLRFEWGLHAPGAGVSADNFSARWTRTVNLEWTGNYRFYANSDDGLRVWVDDLLVIDQWLDRQDAWVTADVSLAAGEHRLKVEYYEHEGAAMAKLVYQPEATLPWKAEYFTNIELDGTPGMTDYLDTLTIDWGSGSPGKWFHHNWFSARFTRDVFMAAGVYQFNLTTEGGVRLWVDGGLVIDQWHETAKTTYSGTAAVKAGNHHVQVEYYESYRNASLSLLWQPAQPPPPNITGWRGEYYTTPDLSGGAVLVRDDKAIDFAWGDGAPITGLPSDFFSARWTRSIALSPAGYYRFIVLADDGVRLWVGDRLAVDEWHPADSQTYLADVYLTAGTYALKVEYYDQNGPARISVTWQRANTTSTQALVDDTDAGFVRGGDEAGWSLIRSGYGKRFWQASNQAGWWARWTPALPKPGRYEVLAYIPWMRNPTEHAIYYIKHEGDVTTVTIDQRKNVGRWVSLGEYNFNANGTEFAHLDGVTEEAAGSRSIGFDAVKFLSK